MTRIERTHGNYRVIAGEVRGSARAVAYLGRRVVISRGGPDPKSALQTVVSELDDLQAARYRPSADHPPTAEEYEDALVATEDELTIEQRSVLATLLSFPDAVWTVRGLASLAKLPQPRVEKALRVICNRLSERLGPVPNAAEMNPDEKLLSVIAEVLLPGTLGEAEFRLRAEVSRITPAMVAGDDR